MNKHIKAELDNLAKHLTTNKIRFSPFIKNYSKSERKYIEKKCKFYNMQSFKLILKK